MTDEVVTYNNNQASTCISSNDTKRQLFQEESEDASYQLLIRACSMTDTLMLIGKGEFNRRKREKQKEVEWKKYGHCYDFKRLRQLSTVVSSKVQVMMSLEECKS